MKAPCVEQHTDW